MEIDFEYDNGRIKSFRLSSPDLPGRFENAVVEDFDNAAVYCFSPRAGTPAAEMEDDVPESVKLDRQRRLEKIVSKNGRKRLLRYSLTDLTS